MIADLPVPEPAPVQRHRHLLAAHRAQPNDELHHRGQLVDGRGRRPAAVLHLLDRPCAPRPLHTECQAQGEDLPCWKPLKLCEAVAEVGMVLRHLRSQTYLPAGDSLSLYVDIADSLGASTRASR